MTYSLVILGFISIASTTVLGQDQTLAVDADRPGQPHEILGQLVGSWHVTVTFKINNQWNEGKSTCEAKQIFEGRFVQQEYKSQLFGPPFTVLQTYSTIQWYQTAKGKAEEEAVTLEHVRR